jgi:hypothetical protein
MAAGAMVVLYPGGNQKFLQDKNQERTAPMPTTCILLHGLFFMQFKNDLLTVATPKFGDHTFGHRRQGISAIQQILSGTTIDWTNVGLKDNKSSKEKFDPPILQFSGPQTGTGDLLPLGNKEFHFQLILNRPMEIHPFRHRNGNLTDFFNVAKPKRPKSNGKDNVRENVLNSCGAGGNNSFALLVGLVYEQEAGCTLPNVISFYGEHRMACKDIGSTQVNPALIAAQNLFANPGDFDLEFQDVGGFTPVCPPDQDDFGVLKDDELSACELLLGDCFIPPPTKGTNPINCAQFGVNG